MKPVNVLMIHFNLCKLYERLFYVRFEWCMCVCVYVCVWERNWKQAGVSKANSASSHIWLKTKLRIVRERIAMHRLFLPPLVHTLSNQRISTICPRNHSIGFILNIIILWRLDWIFNINNKKKNYTKWQTFLPGFLESWHSWSDLSDCSALAPFLSSTARSVDPVQDSVISAPHPALSPPVYPEVSSAPLEDRDSAQ